MDWALVWLAITAIAQVVATCGGLLLLRYGYIELKGIANSERTAAGYVDGDTK